MNYNTWNKTMLRKGKIGNESGNSSLIISSSSSGVEMVLIPLLYHIPEVTDCLL
jgi:type IV secretory pathway ATPase VirB11/archaellum biosynthesis ATPase